MKKLFAFIFAAVFSLSLANAQEVFQGTLKYDFKFVGEGLEGFEAMLPKGMEMSVLKKDLLVQIKGGMTEMMMGRVLTKGKEGVSYMIKDSEETIYVMDPSKMEEDETAEEAKPTVTKEDETLEIAGYKCQKYRVEMEANGTQVTQYVWVTKDFKFPEMKGGGMSSGMGSSMRIDGLDGVPLKSMFTQGPMTVTMTATTVDTNAPNKKAFKLPKKYDKQDFDMNSMMGGMGM
ncbi:MAG: DUF4412 domain-containing protein [Bacteroidota bacterium]